MILGTLLILFAGSALLPKEAALQASVPASVPLSVKVTSATLERRGVLRCTWKLRNESDKTIHVYSSYLKNFGVDMVQVKDGHTVLVLTTWLTEQHQTYPAYDFPAPAFIDLDPGQEASGTLERKVSIREIGASQKIELVLGYVADLAQFRKDLDDSLKQGVEFQGNSIVRWQKVQYSTPFRLIRR
jgi:hypothetical protein